MITGLELKPGRMAKKLAGKRDPVGKLWHLRYGKIKETGLEAHLMFDVKEKP